MRRVHVKVVGCDDTTHVLLVSISDDEWVFLQKLAHSITASSSYKCMPVMSVRELAPDEFFEV